MLIFWFRLFCLILIFQITGFLEPVAMYGEPAMQNLKQFYLLGCREVSGKPRGKADGLKKKKRIFPGEFGVLSYKKLQIIIFLVIPLVRQMAQDREQEF